MHLLPLIPNARPSLNDGNDLRRKSVGELVPTRSHGWLLVYGLEDPLERDSPPLTDFERHGHLERGATASEASKVSDSHQRGDRVNRERKVDNWVEREVVRGRSTGEKRVLGTQDRRR